MWQYITVMYVHIFSVSPKPAHSYALARNKSEGTILSHASHQIAATDGVTDAVDNDVAAAAFAAAEAVPLHPAAVAPGIINPALPSTYQPVEGNRAYRTATVGGAHTVGGTTVVGGSMKSNVLSSSDAADGYASDVCDYNVPPSLSYSVLSMPPLKRKPNSTDSEPVQSGLSLPSSVVSSRFEPDNSYVRAEQRDPHKTCIYVYGLKVQLRLERLVWEPETPKW